ncbi:hypothetical protein F5878DRAFT_609182 [Lentinula raphanica]|uniref:Uncharacterized protein n=1 Tax=Lentinula raphanica TaxID=153919 RepID=A0AA38UHS3_9AGAR|nr:hypothetical protein F5878DRAFT_609182 [Lentinula raphanica]
MRVCSSSFSTILLAMPLHLKRTISQSTIFSNQDDEDHGRYTRMRLLLKDGDYEDEVQILRARIVKLQARVSELEYPPNCDGTHEDEVQKLRARNVELQARVSELEDDMDTILNEEMDDVVKLKEDVQGYYRRYRRAQTKIMELEEVISKYKGGDRHTEYISDNASKELDASRPEFEKLETHSSKANSVTLSPGLAQTGNHATSQFTSSASIIDTVDDKNPTASDKRRGNDATFTDDSSAQSIFISPSIPADDISTNDKQNAHDSHERFETSFVQTVSYPEDGPDSGWFFDAFHYLKADLGPQYNTLIRLWVAFERKSGFDTPHKLAGLAAAKSPVVLSVWRKNRRRFLSKVDQSGLSTPEFVAELWAWWATLQPQWRTVDNDGKPLPFDDFGDDMAPLDKHGKNGWLCLLVCVKWWGNGLQTLLDNEQVSVTKDWLVLVADMTKMLQQLVAQNGT